MGPAAKGRVIVEADALPASSPAIGFGLHDDEGRRLWIEEMDFDPRPVFGQARVPALLFYGEDDAWTPVAESIEAWPPGTRRRHRALALLATPEWRGFIWEIAESFENHWGKHAVGVVRPLHHLTASGCGDSTTDRGSARGHF